MISAAPSQTNPGQFGESCQLLFCAITVSPENSCKNGLARVPGTENGNPAIDGPRERTRTLLGTEPSIINPPIITLFPVSTRLRVEMLLSETLRVSGFPFCPLCSNAPMSHTALPSPLASLARGKPRWSVCKGAPVLSTQPFGFPESTAGLLDSSA